MMEGALASQAPTASVDLLRENEHDAWERFVDQHPKAAIYHSLAWRAVTEEGLGHRAYYLRALNAAGQVAGVLPLFLVKGVFGRRLVSMPMRDRGGVVAQDAATAAALVRGAIELTRELRCRYLELRCLEPMDEHVVGEQGLLCQQQWITTRIDLAPGKEALWKALDRHSLRWSIRKAEKEGVQVESIEDISGIDTFYAAFARTRRRLGIPTFPRALFHSIWRHLIRSGRANLLVARRGNSPINAMISLFSKDAFIPAYAAPQREYSKLYPSESILWHAIEWSVARGFRYFDFGADSPRQEGLLFFKRKWGGVAQPMSYYFYLNRVAAPPDFDSSSPAYDVARRVWTKLPTPVSKLVGGWVTRQLS